MDPLERLLRGRESFERAMAEGHEPTPVPQGMSAEALSRFLERPSPAGYNVTWLPDNEFIEFGDAVSERNLARDARGGAA